MARSAATCGESVATYRDRARSRTRRWPTSSPRRRSLTSTSRLRRRPALRKPGGLEGCFRFLPKTVVGEVLSEPDQGTARSRRSWDRWMGQSSHRAEGLSPRDPAMERFDKITVVVGEPCTHGVCPREVESMFGGLWIVLNECLNSPLNLSKQTPGPFPPSDRGRLRRLGGELDIRAFGAIKNL